MKYDQDKRIVMTLDAGGTNFVFSAIQAHEEIVTPITLPSNAYNLEACLNTVFNGFTQIKKKIPEEPIAISFAFPGPADYRRGIIGDTGNLTAFRGGVALGPMLEEKFKLPVFINNDGDLYAYGESIAGFLPYINDLLDKAGRPIRYKNLLGITLGTGFGGGIVRDGQLYLGDNSAACEICSIRNKLDPTMRAEEGASIRAVQGTYAKETGINFEDSPDPKEIYEIAIGKAKGNKEAAILSFRRMGEVVGDVLANAITLLDGMVVIGGGLAGAHSLFLPTIVEEMNSRFEVPGGGYISRMMIKAFNLEDDNELEEFIYGDPRVITIPDTDREIIYDPLKRIGVGITKLGTNKATSLGAYAFALDTLDNL